MKLIIRRYQGLQAITHDKFDVQLFERESKLFDKRGFHFFATQIKLEFFVHTMALVSNSDPILTLGTLGSVITF